MKPILTFFKQKHTVLRVFLPAAIAFLTACEKVLDIDLKDSEPKIVIEGNLTDQPDPYTVKLSRSVGFNAPNTFPGINNALVIISDNAGNADTLTETGSGVYQTKHLQGVPGRNYFLKVITDGQTFESVSTMPAPISIQEIFVEPFEFNPKELTVKIKFQDPAGEQNNYRAYYIVNGVASDQLLYLDDEYQNGKQIEGTFYDDDLKLKSGDSVQIIMQTIDANVLRYLREQDLLRNGQLSSPANPTSNISNGAFGYFSAQGQTSASIVVP